MKKKSNSRLISLILPALVLASWHLVTTMGVFPTAILPPIDSVGRAFIRMLGSGQLFTDVRISVTRVLVGYSIAAVVGIAMGTLMGTSDRMNRFFAPTLNAIRQIPILAWIPLIILWFGIGEESKIVIIILAAYFPILLNTFSGIRSTPKGYVEVARLYRLGKWEVFRKVYFPSALPQIFVGLKLGLGISWVAVVASELIAASSGICFRISDARSLMMADVVIVGMMVIGTIGMLMDRGLTMIFRKLSPWAVK